MDLNQMMLEIMEAKWKELEPFKNTGIFNQFNFEANAIGQIGESFVKKIFTELNIPMKEFGDVIHDEFDICLQNGKKIEVKTARKGLKNNSFQFNGINPNYNCDFIICIGICSDKLVFKIVSGKKIYDHKSRKFYLDIDGENKQIVAMNPQNLANYKLTLSLSKLESIDKFETILNKILYI